MKATEIKTRMALVTKRDFLEISREEVVATKKGRWFEVHGFMMFDAKTLRKTQSAGTRITLHLEPIA